MYGIKMSDFMCKKCASKLNGDEGIGYSYPP